MFSLHYFLRMKAATAFSAS